MCRSRVRSYFTAGKSAVFFGNTGREVPDRPVKKSLNKPGEETSLIIVTFPNDRVV